jgi:hypothetical protein
MPKLIAKRKHYKGGEILVEFGLESGSKKFVLTPVIDGPNSIFKLPQKYVKALSDRTLKELRILAETSRQYMVDRIYAGRAQDGNIVTKAPTYPRSTPGVGGTEPFELAELTPRYRRRKKRKGLDGRILIASGDYTHSLEVKRVKPKGADAAYVMSLPTKKHIGARFVPKGSKRVTYRQLSLILEFGSAKKKIPARPHWRPTGREMGRRFNRAPAKLSASALRDFLISEGWDDTTEAEWDKGPKETRRTWSGRLEGYVAHRPNEARLVRSVLLDLEDATVTPPAPIGELPVGGDD